MKTAPKALDDELTPKQQKIVDMVVLGLNNENIAARMNVKVDTIKKQLTAAMEKRNAQSRLDLAVTVLTERHRIEKTAMEIQHMKEKQEIRRQQDEKIEAVRGEILLILRRYKKGMGSKHGHTV